MAYLSRLWGPFYSSKFSTSSGGIEQSRTKIVDLLLGSPSAKEEADPHPLISYKMKQLLLLVNRIVTEEYLDTTKETYEIDANMAVSYVAKLE